MLRVVSIFSVFIFFLTQLAHAQSPFPVQIQVSVLPPYSAYLQDYPGTGQRVRVFLINTSRQTYQVRLTGQLTGDNGIEIRTSANYRPPRPLTVPPGQTLLSRTDLEGLFDLNQIDVTGIDKNLLARGFPLPDGTYQLCVRAFNESTANTSGATFGQPLSPEFPLGCSAPIVVRSVEPPILISPLCDADVTATTPQAVVFTWTPPVGVSPAQVDYTLRIVELPQMNVDPNVFIDAIALPKSGVEVRSLRTSTFLYGPTQPPLQPGKRYAWRVQAIDRLRRLNFLNDGKAPVCVFTYGTVPKQFIKPGIELVQTPVKLLPIDTNTITPPARATAVAITKPAVKSAVLVACLEPNYKPELTAGNGTDLFIGWQANRDFLLTVAKALNAPTDSAYVRSIIQTIPGAGYEVRLTNASTKKIVSTLTTTKEFISLATDAPSFPLVFGQKYTYQVRLVLPANTLAQLKLLSADVLTAPACLFTLVKKEPNKNGFIVRGTLRYRFDNGKAEDFPANNTDVKLTFGTGNVVRAMPGTGAGGQVKSAVAPVYYGKTDANGQFSVPVPWEDLPKLQAMGVPVASGTDQQQSNSQQKVDASGTVVSTSKTVVKSTQLTYQVSLPSDYYQSPVQSFTLPYATGDSSVSAGTIRVIAYGYSLKVLVSKVFNSVYAVKQQFNNGQQTAGLNAGGTTTQVYDKRMGYGIDNTYSEPLSGIEMYLFRKTKPDWIPAVEGQIGQKKLSQLDQGAVLVAQGVTSMETQTGKQQAVVTFDRLLGQMNPGDEYYLTAKPDPKKGIAPGKQIQYFQTGDQATITSAGIGFGSVAVKDGKLSKGGSQSKDYIADDPNATFAAPIDEVAFTVPPQSTTGLAGKLAVARGRMSDKTYVDFTVNYGLRSLLPPTSTLTGRLMYAWPNETQKFVMANMPFSVRVGYGGIPDAYKPYWKEKTLANGTVCHIYVSRQMTVLGSDGKTPLPFNQNDDNGFVAATGKTDANGYFSLDNVVNITQKGAFTVKFGPETDGVCIPDKEIANTAGFKPVVGGKALGKQLLDQVGNPDIWSTNASQHDIFSYGNLGAVEMDNGVQSVMNTNASDFQSNFQTSDFNAYKAFAPLKTNAATSAPQKQTKAGKGGPANEGDDETAETDENVATLYRSFYLELATTIYTPPKIDIVVQASESKNLGECLSTVKGGKGRTAKVVRKGTNEPVKGARVVIYKATAVDGFRPELEGDGQNRYLPLPFSSKSSQQFGKPFPSEQPVAWVADGFTDENGIFTANEARLLDVGGMSHSWNGPGTYTVLPGMPYSYYVMPKEDDVSFFQATGTTNDNLIRVEAGPSRLIVRLTDRTTKKGIAGRVKVMNAKTGPNGKQTLSITASDMIPTDANGYLELTTSQLSPDKWAKGEARQYAIFAFVDGYHPDTAADPLFTGMLHQMDNQYLIPIPFQPNVSLTGRVQGPKMVKAADGTYQESKTMIDLPAFIRRMSDNAVFETKPDGSFTVAVASNAGEKLIIEPRDLGYFSDTLTLKDLPQNGTKDLGILTMQRVKHRIRIETYANLPFAANNLLPNVMVQLNDQKPIPTSQAGTAEFDFENVSVDNYTIKLTGPPNLNYIPQVFEVQNSESKGYVTYKVALKLGAFVDGNVTLDGQPVANARIYLDYQTAVTDTPVSLSAGGSTGQTNATIGEGLIQTFSADGNANQKGYYVLRGIPVTNGPVTLRATLTLPGKTIIGQAKTVTLTGGKVTASFALTSYSGAVVQSALGFPLAVEELAVNNDGTLTVTGQVNLKAGQTGFGWLPAGEVTRIRKVTYKIIDSGGKKVAVPTSTDLELEGLATLKLRYVDRYNVRLTHAKSTANAPQPLHLTADGDGRGQLRGRVQIVDNSFNYPSTYLSFEGKGNEDFYLASSVKESDTRQRSDKLRFDDASDYVVDNLIAVLRAPTGDTGFQTTASPAKTTPAKYFLTDQAGGSVRFSFVQVPSRAMPIGSYIDPVDKRFHLNIRMNFAIKNAQPDAFTVDIDEVVLDDKEIKPKDGAAPLELQFEKWKLQVKGWTLDPKEGGIVANDPGGKAGKIVMRTGSVDIPFTGFILRHDLFLLPKPVINTLSVGGLATLQVTNADDAVFTYDVGLSKEGHWKIGIFGKGNLVAGILKLNNLKNADDYALLTTGSTNKPTANAPTQVAFDYIQLLSNDQNILSVKSGQTFYVRGNPYASFKPAGFTSGDGFLTLAGDFTIKDAPRLPTTRLQLEYQASKPARYRPLEGGWQFEGRGHTQFTARPTATNLSITPRDIIIDGDVEEPGATPKLHAYFCARAGSKNPYWIQVLKQTVKMPNAERFQVDVVGAVGTQADKTDWQGPLAFIGELYDTGTDGKGTGAMLKKAQGDVKPYFSVFTVYGDMHLSELDANSIKVDSLTSKGGNLQTDKNGNFKLDDLSVFGSGDNANGKFSLDNNGMKIDQLTTPFGKMVLSFDFSTGTLRGSIDVSKDGKPQQLGTFFIKGQASMLLDKQGFYVVGAFMAESPDIPPPIQGISLGVAIGYRPYEEDAKVVLMGTSKDPTLACKINGDPQVRGFFLGGGATLFHKKIDFDIVVAEVWAEADVSLFASVKLDISKTQLSFSAGAVASGELGVRVLCASAKANVLVWGDMSGTLRVSPVGAGFGATLGASFTAKVDACSIGDGYEISKTLALVGSVRFGSCKEGKVFDFDFVDADGKPGDNKVCENFKDVCLPQ